MSEMKHETEKKPDTGLKLVIPFFVVLAVLTVVSFCIPLRPTQSNREKRNLAEFPEFSVEALISGSYFDDITTWFSDTFPGREEWLTLSDTIEIFHGYSEISISGDLPMMQQVPEEPAAEPSVSSTEPEETEALCEMSPGEQSQPEETVPAETEWGGIHAGDLDVELSKSAVIQIGDAAFNAVGFSEVYSNRYASTVSDMADRMEEKGIRVISAPCPTAIGILVEPEYLEMMNCADQEEMISFLHETMDDNIVKVDTFNALVPHNSEYIYFRTDHHWTALGAYYSYEAICKALDMEPAPLENFEEWNQGEFEGSIYWKATHSYKLKLDELIAYVPPGDITMTVYNSGGYGRVAPVIQDMTTQPRNARYSAFICSDNPLTVITNDSLPEGTSCVLVKDSFGNCLAPFFTQNYHTVYVIDYRKYSVNLSWFVENYEVDDIIMAPYLIAIQAIDGNNMFARLCS